ncbi:collagen alpha-1(I) chain-like [Amblyraja radiata]|uniref:collagen alpha-1(I) chain-like n=1 Tax=Amblyraja radiata TaxID=386614 RepID=UPI001403B0BB|nr:collagen alpha-1(I) chain-like [Amblyraja radiata]
MAPGRGWVDACAVRPGGLEMEVGRSEVIATTPPRACCMEEEEEEAVSQASSPGSGTHLSSVSGFSLGEAIVQRAKQGTELWSQLQSGPDTGELTSATAARLLTAGAELSQTLEEGTITEQLSPQSQSGQFQSPHMFEMQESALSPALALVTACSTQLLDGDLSQSFFHRSPLEFAPLRAAPDLSVGSPEGCAGAFQANNLLQLLISEVSADCVRGSLSLSQEVSRDGSEAFPLSQHPLSPPTPSSEDDDFTRADSYFRDQRFMELPSRPTGNEGVEEPQNPTGAQDLSDADQRSGQPGGGQRAAGLQGCDTDDGESLEPLWNLEESDGTVSPWGQPVDGTDPLQVQPAAKTSPVSGPGASSRPVSTGSPACSSGQAVGPGARPVTPSTESLTPNSSKNDTAIEVVPGGGDVRSGAGQEFGLSPAPAPAQPSRRSTLEEGAVENAPGGQGPARHQRAPLAPVFATAGSASPTPPGRSQWPTFDSLVLQGLRGVAPRQQAYRAVADSLNRMLARANVGAEGREGPERASPRAPSPHPPADLGDRETAPAGSSSDRGHGPAAATLSPPDPTPSEGQGPETGSRGWSSVLTPPGPYTLTSAHAHQLDTTPTDDGLLPPGSSLDTSRAAERTLTMSSHSLTSLEVDNYVPAWAPSTLTPEANQFNIDDRIQVYLRNLGISQSPSSILASQGPDQDAEFNHAELRKLPEEATRGYQGEEGVSALDRDSGSTFYSNVLTHSVSIGLGSEAGSDSPQPTQPWEGRGMEAADSRSHSGYWLDPRASSPLPDPHLSLTGDSLDENGTLTPPAGPAAHRSGGFFPGLDSPGLSPAGRGAVTEPPLPSAGGSPLPRHGDDPYRRGESFVGSETLSEIRKLLGEASRISAWRPDLRSHRSPFPAETDHARDPGGSSRPLPEGATLTSLSPNPGPDPAQPPPPTSVPLPRPGGAWAAASGSTKPGKSTDGSSRTDLASAQLTSRTRDQSPVTLTSYRCPATPEMDPRAQGWGRSKGSVWPLDALSILDEEDRRKIDEIKAELLHNSKTSTSPQGTWWAGAEDSSLKSDPSSSADSSWPAHPLAGLPSLGTARSRPQSPAGGAALGGSMGEPVPVLSVCQQAQPIAAITFSSRRKPCHASPSPSTTQAASPSAPQASSLLPSAPHPSSASYSAPLPSSALSSTPLPTSLPPSAPLPAPPPVDADPAHGSPEAGLGGEEGWWPRGDPWPVGKSSRVGGSPAESCSPPRSPIRTVMSHVRVTLSPNRPDTLGTPPSPPGMSRLTGTDAEWTRLVSGRHPSPARPHLSPSPPHPSSAPAVAHTGPPYPPLPMPMPAFWPSLPLLFERPSEGPTAEAGQTLGRDWAGERVAAVKDGSKVDVSTQTSGLGQSPPPPAQCHDSTEETAPETTGTTTVSGHAGHTDVHLMLPYKPAGSSELFYVANAGMRRRIGLGDSENSSDVCRPDPLEAARDAVPSHAGRSRGYCSLRARGERGESGPATTSYLTRGTEDRGARRPRTHPTHHAAVSVPLLTRDPGGEGSPPRAGASPPGGEGSASCWAPQPGVGVGVGSRGQAWPGEVGAAGLSYKERAKAASIFQCYMKFCVDNVAREEAVHCCPNNKPWVTKAHLNQENTAFRNGDREEQKDMKTRLRQGWSDAECRILS